MLSNLCILYWSIVGLSRPFVDLSVHTQQIGSTKGSCLYAVRLELDAPVTNSSPAT